MDDKIFNLIETMYADLKQDIGGVKNEVAALRQQVTSIDNTVTKVENELGKKVEAALDGYKQVYEKLLEHDQRFDSIEDKLDRHDTQIGQHEVQIKALKKRLA